MGYITPYQAAVGYARADVLRALVKKQSRFVGDNVIGEVDKCARLLVKLERKSYMRRGKLMSAEWNRLEKAETTR